MRSVYRVALLAFCLVLVGCSGKGANRQSKVSGKVTYNGNPVTGGLMTWHFSEGRSVPITIEPDGNFSASQVPSGEATVTVDNEMLNPNRPEYGKDRGKGGGASPVPKDKQKGGPAGIYVEIKNKN
ncbi:MAG: hypothetical protein K2W96_11405, partial [Gemmataceae bacterium]|nr:hypothetical protein [Gemmataceae bacterium]